MAAGIHGVNHVACLARNMDETVRFYQDFLDVTVRRIASDTPGQKHYCLDVGGEGTLDFFEATPGTEASQRDRIGALNHLAITADPEVHRPGGGEAYRRLYSDPRRRASPSEDDLLLRPERHQRPTLPFDRRLARLALPMSVTPGA